MLSGPIDGFIAGITSGPVRLLIGAAAVILGFGVCVLPLPWRDDAFPAIALLAFTSIFRWAHFGGWFFVGLCALVGSFAFLHAFVMERTSSISLFATFTLAAIFFAPVTFSDRSWLSSGTWRWSVVLYMAASTVYWFLPYAVVRFTNRKVAS